MLLIALLFAVLAGQGFLKSIASAATAARHGNLRVTTYRKIGNDSRAERLPGVGIHLNRDCNGGPHYDTVTRNTGTGHPDNGTAYFSDCPVDRTTNKGTYNLSINSVPAGFHMADETSKTFEITWAGLVAASEISFILEKDSVASGPSQFQSTPVTGGGGGGNPTPISDNDKNGKIQFTSYIREPNGSLTRQAGLNIRTNAFGFAPGQKSADGKTLLNCDDYNKTTDQGGGSASANSNYAQAHFTGCWTGSGGSKEYQIYYAALPANYQFRSLHITNGTFNNGATSTSDSSLPVTFKVLKNKETDLQFWIEKVVVPADARGTPPSGAISNGSQSPSTKPNSTGGSSGRGSGGNAPSIEGVAPGIVVRQVIGSRQNTFVAVRGGEPAVSLATILTQNLGIVNTRPPPASSCNKSINPNCEEDCPDETDPSCPNYIPPDSVPPPAPKNFKIKLSESGRPELSWDKVEGDVVLGEGGKPEKDDNGNDKREDISYRIERLTAADSADTTPTIIDIDSDVFNFTDEGDSFELPQVPAKAPGSYTYRLYSLDEVEPPEGPNISTSPAVQEITLTIPPPQVPEDQDDQPATPEELGSGSTNPQAGGVSFRDTADTTHITVPVGAGGTQPLACAVVNRDNLGRDVINAIGEPQATTQGLSCTKPDGEEAEEYQEEVEYEVDIENSLVSDDTELYGFDGTDWQEIDTDNEEGSNGEGTTLEYSKAQKVKGDRTTYKVRSKKPMTLAIIDKHNQSKLIKIAAMSAMAVSLGGIGFITYAIIVRRRQQQIALKPYEDVDLVPLNPRIDYTPTITSPHSSNEDDNQRGAIAIRILEFLLVVVIALVLVASLQMKAFAESPETKKTTTPAQTCEDQVAMLNSRSAILNQYKKTEEAKFQQLRAKWSKRATYAGQWVPKDAEKVRDSIYKLDNLHKDHMKVVSDQINEFLPLESSPLDCSDGKKDQVKQKLEIANGTKKGKDLTGYLLVQDLNGKESKYKESEFNKSTDKMLKKLHGAKDNNPKPKKSMTVVDNYQ